MVTNSGILYDFYKKQAIKYIIDHNSTIAKQMMCTMPIVDDIIAESISPKEILQNANVDKDIIDQYIKTLDPYSGMSIRYICEKALLDAYNSFNIYLSEL